MQENSRQQILNQFRTELRNLLIHIYSEKEVNIIDSYILELIKKYEICDSDKNSYFSEKDIILITYADSLQKVGELPLQTLYRFVSENLKDSISAIHILPFFPYSSDDGFSVIDYYQVRPDCGTWDDIHNLGTGFNLMFDYVLNHISAQSQWFRNYLAEKTGYSNLAIEVEPATDLSSVVRPRSLPLLTKFTKNNQKNVHLWTTFSADQIDLNFKSIDVLLKMIDVLLFYVKNGASIIRLDAIAYLWKEPGTTCIHLPQTHYLVKLFRKVLNAVRPDGILLTETNVPHEENISYFGNGSDEAQVIYNFTLPPLLLYSFMKEDIRKFNNWAETLHTPSGSTTFLNFTASHDGIGVRPLEGIIPSSELDEMVTMVKDNGGQISYKINSDGTQSPYELNITYVDALKRKNEHEYDEYHVNRFLASQSIPLVLPGIPAIYIHSLLGSHNWAEGVKQTGRARTINRAKLTHNDVFEALTHQASFRYRVLNGYKKMLTVRQSEPAFHPNAAFEILHIHPQVFAIKRSMNDHTVYALTNISSGSIQIERERVGLPANAVNILEGEIQEFDTLKFRPYDVFWLKRD